MAAKKESTIPAIRTGWYQELVKTSGEEIKGASMPYTSKNGHMFSFLDPAGNLGLRLPKEEREIFMERYSTRLCEAHGTILKEYVLVPAELFRETKELQPYFEKSLAYVSGLKPKVSK